VPPPAAAARAGCHVLSVRRNRPHAAQIARSCVRALLRSREAG
jgi:hypothetical protein